MNYAVKWEWNRHCDQSVGQKAKSVASISSLSPYNLGMLRYTSKLKQSRRN